jgi:glutaredoxin
MEKVIVLGLRGCVHCNALSNSLKEQKIPFEFRDVDLKEHSDLADRMEALLKTNSYPMVIIERGEGAKYLYLVGTLDEAKESPISFATKIGCVSTDSMVAIIKKYLK